MLKNVLQQYHVRSASDVPSHFSLDIGFYKKYVDIMGIPVLSSDKVCDCVLQKAAWIVHGTISHLIRMSEVLNMMVANKHRVAIMARSEKTTDVPEHRMLEPKNYWDERARGLGGIPGAPCSSGAEESVMCESWQTNSYFGENILLHEFSHGIARLGFVLLDANGNLNNGGGSASGGPEPLPTPYPNPDGTVEVPEIPVPSEQCFDMKLQASCKEALGCRWDHSKGRCFHDCKAMQSESACWPTGECAWDGSTQSCHKCLVHVDKYNRCEAWAKKGYCSIRARWMKDHCSDSCGGANNGHKHCEHWARSGECAKNPGYMLQYCQQSCGCKQLMPQ